MAMGMHGQPQDPSMKSVFDLFSGKVLSETSLTPKPETRLSRVLGRHKPKPKNLAPPLPEVVELEPGIVPLYDPSVYGSASNADEGFEF